MQWEIERDVPVSESLAVIDSIFAREGLTVELSTAMEQSSFPVYKCIVRDRDGGFVNRSWGRGRLTQARASALFEAWQQIQHLRGQQALPRDGRLRLMKISEVLEQPELCNESMLHRLAKDYPECELGCLQYQSANGRRNPVWHPAFARNPVYRWHPAAGDKLEYEPYLRYSSDAGSGAGISRNEALLHALLEAIQIDALSFAYLDWYLREPPKIYRVDPQSLPAGLQELWAEVRAFIGCEILLFDTTTDIGVPTYSAVPATSGLHVTAPGIGASLYPAYAAERCLTELARSVYFAKLNREATIDTTYQGRLAKIKPWPLLERIVRLDTEPFHNPETGLVDFASRAALAAEGIGTGEQVTVLNKILEASQLQSYFFPWTPADAACQVVSVLVPGADNFAMVRNTTPVLPTARAMNHLYEIHPEMR